ncbi:MAG TPA: hypothetical protein DD666_19335 [Advenella kashmirensis]|uniref:Uncharacterized protein n=1 Tax=Advenella kashmirensis TaxID=310575 RepID=A0A356LKK0_9BURK|nr:hypothetical protein [Advenella kashmirensis]
MGARIGYGNHSQDASLEFDGKIITTRTWQERIDTLRASPILPIEIHQKYTGNTPPAYGFILIGLLLTFT